MTRPPRIRVLAVIAALLAVAAGPRATHPFLGVTSMRPSFTVDKAGGSEGMQVGEVADVLRRDYGVWDALNLDAAARRRWRWRIR